MLADGEIVGDGSWNLTIYVTDLNEKRTMVVKGDMHIGGVMLKLTESFGKIFWSTTLLNDFYKACNMPLTLIYEYDSCSRKETDLFYNHAG